jgi:hypothetical protein
MSKAKGSIGSLRTELISKSKQAMLCAIKIYNDPLVTFKSESFIVLSIIAWTYLLHAFYRGKGIDYRYHKLINGRRKFDRTAKGAFKFWELERCLNDDLCPINSASKQNLRFLIGLRHEVEHQMAKGLDTYLSSRYQACAVNFNDALIALFGADQRLDDYLAFSIQFAQLTPAQLEPVKPGRNIPQPVLKFITEFDKQVPEEEFNSSKYAYRLLFTKKLVNHPGQADKVVEFIDPKSELAKTINKEYWIKKEVEKPKFKPKNVVAKVKAAGFSKFRVQPDHVTMWQSEDAKNPAKGFGVTVDGQWFWYQSWVDRCIELCKLGGNKFI